MKTKKISLFLLIVQLFIPLFLTFSSVAQAVELSHEESRKTTLLGIKGNLPDLNSQFDSTAVPNKDYFSYAAAKTGQVLSSDSSSDAVRNLIEGKAYGLLNSQMSNWLNQYGHAKVSIGSKSRGSIDFLLPLYDVDESLLFSQARLQRKSENRTTMNLGLGYRYYADNWMWGANSFYDHDLRNNNRRWGIGFELGADYVKLSTNAYFRLSNWRQSKLHNFKDYDERPANGFDVRLEGFLPSYPQLGANVKYEKYFGKGVNLSNSTSIKDLKDNPQAYTVGMSYTPFPLLSFKLNHSMGDINDTKGLMEINYRLGVPLNQQLDATFVNNLRTLKGSRYDFVDRNYDIIMQYKKQELLKISLPNKVLGQSKQSISIPLTVIKAKYAISTVEWSALTLIANGGRITSSSKTGVNIVLPAYDPYGTNIYQLTAIATDANGNKSNIAITNIEVGQIDGALSFVVTPNSDAIANNSDYYTATVTVTDKTTGEPLVNTNVTFTSSNVTLFTDSNSNSSSLTISTNSSGQAIIKIKSTIAQTVTLTAMLENGLSDKKSLNFISDASTAKIVLTSTMNNSPANANTQNTMMATVTDANGNLVTNTSVTLTIDDGATLSITSGVTDSEGKLSFAMTSTKAGTYKVTAVATSSGDSTTADTTFIADKTTMQIVLTAGTNNSAANGTAENSMTATVTDANGNVITDQSISLTVSGSGTTLSISTGTTDSNGALSFTITSTKAGTFTVTGSAGSSSHTADTTFIADVNTMQIVLETGINNSKANGSAQNTMTATVTDANGNIIANQNVSLTVNGSGASLSSSTGTTDNSGKFSFSITSTTAGDYTVTGIAGSATNTAISTFIADTSTMKITLSNGTNNSAANGTAENSMTAKVTDANGNVISGQSVSLTINGSDATLSKSTGTTDSNGELSFTITSTKAATYTVTGTASSASNTGTTTFVADVATMQIILAAGTNNSKANGSAQNTMTATVTDANGNVITDQSISLTISGTGANLSVSTGTTDSNGKLSFTITSTKADTFTITGTAGSAINTATSTFIADISTIQIILEARTNNSKADGSAKNTMIATVTDANGNVITNQTVDLSINGSGAALSATTGTTNSNGQLSFEITSITAATFTVTGTASSASNTATTTFIADTSTATVTFNNDIDKSYADGTSTNKMTAIVKDSNGNVVSGEAVSLRIGTGANLSISSGTSSSDGTFSFTITSTTAGAYTVTGTVDSTSNTGTGTTIFIADTTNIKIMLSTDVDGSAANGKATNAMTAKVTDANDNIIVGQTVTLTITDGATLSTASGTAGSDGQFSFTITSKTANSYTVTASVTDVSGTKTATKTTTFVADVNTMQITLTSTNDNSAANGSSQNGMTAKVTDVNGNIISGASITLSVGSDVTLSSTTGTSSSYGTYAFTMTSTKAGSYEVSATAALSGSTATTNATTTFIADKSTMNIVLASTSNGAVADGSATNAMTATVTDENGNVISGQTVSLSIGSGATLSITSGTTSSNGTLDFTITSKTATTYTVTGTADSASNTATTTFVADKSTMEIVLASTLNNSAADSTTQNAMTATVTDANGNIIVGQTVTLSISSSNASLSVVTGTTNSSGVLAFTITSKTAGTYTVTGSITDQNNNTKTDTEMTTFIADKSTMQIVLTSTTDNSVADGTATNTMTATVTDANGNVISDTTVSLSIGSGATLSDTSGTTSAEGTFNFTITSNTAATYTVTGSVTDSSGANKTGTQTTTFIADKSTMQIVLTSTTNNSAADGTATNAMTAKVTDANDNVISGTTVSLSIGSGATLSYTSGTTSAEGTFNFTITSKTADTYTVTGAVVDSNNETQTGTQTTTFIADKSTMKIVLTSTTNNSVANGTTTNAMTAKVTDANDNVISGTIVSLSIDSGATLSDTSGTTGDDGTFSFTITSTTAATYTVTGSVVDSNSETKTGTQITTFILIANETNSTIALSPSRIVNNGGTTTEGTATVTFTLKDYAGNLITGMASKITFTDTNSTGNLSIGSVTESSTGVYTATVTSKTTGTYTIKASYAGDTSSFTKTTDTLTVYTYTFALEETTRSILASAKYQFIVQATASDTGTVTSLSSDGTDVNVSLTWVSTDTSIATVDTTGTATGNTTVTNNKTTTITATGTYQGIDVGSLIGSLTVKGAVYSDWYGTALSTDSSNTYIIEPPSYSLYARGDSYVDALGTAENHVGGEGGTAVTIEDLNKVTSITLSTGYSTQSFNQEPGVDVIISLQFTLTDGSTTSQVGGSSGDSDYVNRNYSTETIPDGYVLQGYEVTGGTYIHAIRFIYIPTE